MQLRRNTCGVNRLLKIALICLPFYSFGQCNNTITAPSTVCINENFNIETENYSNFSYEWDFCGGDFLQQPSYENKYIGSPINAPFHFELVNNGNHYVGFVANGGAKNLLRFDFASGLDNAPDISKVNILNAPAFDDIRSVRIVKEGENWYGLMSDLFQSKLFRLNFGNSLSNDPTIETFDFSSLNLALDLSILKEGPDYYVLILNYGANYITRIKFASTITANPTLLASINIPGANAISISAKKICSSWICFAALNGSSSICRIDLGNSIETNAGAIKVYPGFNSVRGISFEEEKDGYFVFASTASGELYTLNFGMDPLADPITISAPNQILSSPGNTAWDIEMLKEGTNWHLYFMDYGKVEINHFTFSNPCDASIVTGDSSNVGQIHYSSSGNKSVILKITDPNGAEQLISKDISVASDVADIAAFTHDDIKCINTQVNFTAVAKPSIVEYVWKYGDAGTNSGQTASHVYSAPGTYTAHLEILSSNGCKNESFEELTFYSGPIAEFLTPTNNPLCTNQQFTFPNTSTFDVGSSPSWEWFVNGTSVSTAKDLKQSFSSATAQTVKLKASIPGCFTESSQVINSLLAGPQLGFTVAGMCEGDAVTFTNTTTDPVLGFAWDFGDSQSSTSTDASHNYTSHGNYTVSLQASNANGCQNTVIKNIVLYTKPQSDFSLSLPPFSCSGNVSQFNDLTANPTDSNIASWAWNFDDAGSAQNTSAQKNAQHTYSLAGDYNVALTTKTNRGCSGTIQKQVTIAQSPQANFTNTPACRDVPVVFTDTSTGTITSWYWQMDNTFYFVAQPKPTHIFTSSKTYPVSLTVTASNNCISVVNKNLVIPVPLVPSFTVEKNCTDQNTNFIDMTNSIADPIQAYDWQFANLGTGTGSPSQFTFATAGKYDVTMNATALSGCTYSATAKIDIVPGPVASFSASPETGVPPLEVQFNNTSENAKYYAWSFNDNSSSPTSIENSPKHTFVDFGEYVVDLTASNDLSCANTISKIIKTVLPNKDIAIIALNTIKNDDGSLKVIATLKNNGNVVLQNLPLVADVSGFTSIRESVTGPIAPAATFNYTFTYEILLTKGLDFLCGDIQLDGDVNADDNKICTSLNDTFYLYAPYPNPVNATINLDWITPDVEPLQVEIYDAMSKLIATYHYQGGAGLNQADLSVEHLTNGIYVFRISTTTTSRIYKIAIAH